MFGSLKPATQGCVKRSQTLELRHDDRSLSSEPLREELDPERVRWPVLACPLRRRASCACVPRSNLVIGRGGPQGAVQDLDDAVSGLLYRSSAVPLQLIPCAGEQLRNRR